ncbi:YcxB family protein [Marinilactibacillus kalidii]|uniref:YcxB family protein n=1 Tax=Marinilactibacillus kalidii TaxID=2820274 RepID=UPI001ABDFB82|nr:YcxB family protein [Marinilactibacillus kalidii]
MIIEYEIEEEDYISFNYQHTLNSPTNKKALKQLRFGLAILVIPIAYFTGTLLFKQPSLYWVIISLGLSLYLLYAYPKMYNKAIKKQLSKLVNEGDNSSYFGKKKLEILDNQLILTDEASTSKLMKGKIKEIKEYDDIIVLYTSSVSAYIIPKRYLNQEELNAIKSIVV